jgi:putative phosphoserine phosphatase / 1-acylglycerol-3-phosphate O-acyltransferase
VTAVFVDLDRTLLREGSGPVLTRALEAAGLPVRRLPADGLWWAYYNRLGETTLSMALARASTAATRGWDVAASRAAAEAAVPELLALLAPGGLAAVRDWQKDGRRVLLVTTTPEHLVAPLADAVGVDGVLATRLEERDGRFTGALDGGFVWGTGKLDRVRAYCAAEGLELGDATAVSDSVFDLPLLRAVGEPLCVNPDPRLWLVARALRWPIAHWDAAGGVPSLLGVEPFGVLRHLLVPQLFPYARFEFCDVGRIPDEGPVVLASNHRSYFDVAALALLAARISRPVRALAKRELFDLPIAGTLLRSIGALPVDRGRSGAAAFAEAAASLHRGEVVVVLPQGTIPRGHAFFDPTLVGHTGAVRLARATDAAVVPVGLWGTEAVWPRASRLPDVTTVLSPRPVTVQVGEPVQLRAPDAKDATVELMAAISALLPDEARRAGTPSEADLARTRPAGGWRDG